MNDVIAAYAQIIPTPLMARLWRFAGRAEGDKMLHAEQLRVIVDQGWFKAFIPEHLGGMALDLPAAVRLEEALGYVDGSVGWTVTLCAGAGLFVGFMDSSVLPAVASSPEACVAGSGQPLGIAVAKDGGYELSGQWPYATGIAHSTVVTANCRIVDGNGDDDAQGPIKAFFLFRDQVDLIADWDTMGLRGSGSHSFRVERAWVPASHAFEITPEAARLPGAIYRYPFIPFSEITLAANTLGMCVRLLELCEERIHTRGDARSWAVLDEVKQGVRVLRGQFHELVSASWAEHCNGDLRDSTERAIAQTCRQLVRHCQAAAARIYPHAGMDAAQPSSALNRVWRDLFTASQHSMLRD